MRYFIFVWALELSILKCLDKLKFFMRSNIIKASVRVEAALARSGTLIPFLEIKRQMNGRYLARLVVYRVGTFWSLTPIYVLRTSGKQRRWLKLCLRGSFVDVLEREGYPPHSAVKVIESSGVL